MSKLYNAKFLTIIAGLLLFVLILPFILPSSFYIGLIEQRIERKTGVNVTIDGDYQFGLLPNLYLSAQNVKFEGDVALGVRVFGHIDSLEMRTGLFDFLTGSIHLRDFLVLNSRVTLNGDFTPFIPDWLRNRLGVIHKKDIRYAEVLKHLIKKSSFETAQIKNAAIFWNKTEDENYYIQDLTLSARKPVSGEDFSVTAQANINGRTSDMSLRIERPGDFLKGYRSQMKVSFDSTPVQIDFNGSAAHRGNFIAQGTVSVDIPSAHEFCMWTSPKGTCNGKEGTIRLSGALKLRDQRLLINNAAYVHGPTLYGFNGQVDFKEYLPTIVGTLTIPATQSLNAKSILSFARKIDFNDFIFETYNARLNIVHNGLTIRPDETIKPQIKISVQDTRLQAQLMPLNLLGGQADVDMKWQKTSNKGQLNTRIALTNIDFSLLQKSLRQKIGIKGTMTTRMDLVADGSTLSDFFETVRTEGNFAIVDGAFTNSNIIQSLKGQGAKTFDFTEIRGRLNGNNGVILSKDFPVVAPMSNVRGQARADLKNNELTITLKSHYQGLEDEPEKNNKKGYVLINGPFQELIMKNSLQDGPLIPEMEGMKSGLIPLENDVDVETNGQGVLKSTDILD